MKDEQNHQVEAFIDEANFWKEERFVALENDDIEAFNEFEKFYQEALKNVEKADLKYQATVAKFEIEKAAKEGRELAERVKAEEADFELRSAERET